MASLLKRLSQPNVAALCGFTGPFFAFLCIMIAILVSPWFTWQGNALSDLGHPLRYAESPLSSFVFNYGLIIAGIITLFFVFGLWTKVKSILARISTVILLFADIALICIGVFPETMPPWHFIFSVMLFASAALSILFFAAALMVHRPTRRIGLLSLIIGFIAAIPWILVLVFGAIDGIPVFLNYWQHAAVPETISAVAAYVWILFMSTKLTGDTDIIPRK